MSTWESQKKLRARRAKQAFTVHEHRWWKAFVAWDRDVHDRAERYDFECPCLYCETEREEQK